MSDCVVCPKVSAWLFAGEIAQKGSCWFAERSRLVECWGSSGNMVILEYFASFTTRPFRNERKCMNDVIHRRVYDEAWLSIAVPYSRWISATLVRNLYESRECFEDSMHENDLDWLRITRHPQWNKVQLYYFLVFPFIIAPIRCIYSDIFLLMLKCLQHF